MNWPHQKDCLRLFGNPFSPGWAEKHLVHVVPPYAVVMGKIHVPSIQINKIAAPSLGVVLDAIATGCAHDATQIAKVHANLFSGSFALRKMRGINSISMHAFGLAIDWDDQDNGLGVPTSKCFFHSDSLLVKAFKAEGWIWGGDWKSRTDCMHVQAALVA